MIEIMLTQKGNIDLINLNEAHLTTIRQSEAGSLIDYVEDYLPEYIENVFIMLESNIKESEETVLYLLNSENINNDDKIKIIQKEEVRISDINTISTKELWIDLFKYNKIEAIWDNILYYYQETEELPDEVINYLNIEENYIKLSKSKINNKTDFDKDTILSDLNKKIMLNNKINNQAYKFLEEYELFEIDEDDLILLLKSDKFDVEEKFSFVEKNELSNIQNNVSAKETISKFYIDNDKYFENIDLFEKLFYGKNKYDLELLILQIPYMDNCEKIKQYLHALVEYDEFFPELIDINGKKLYLEDNEKNRLLLNKLVDKGCISSWSENKKTIGKNNLKVERKRV